MGTVFSFDIRSPGVDHRVLDAALAWLHWADATFSTYKPDSEISRLERNEIALGECAAEVREILDRCAELEDQTDGYFSARAGGSLDPSGLVKGWAIQHVSDMLTAGGSANHCVNGGGDVQCVGRPEPGSGWRIGIAHPLVASDLVGTVTGTSFAVATSGSFERGAHIRDPHDRASPSVLASVSMIGRELSTTDAYATAAFAMGAGAPHWIESLDGYQGLVVFADGTQWVRPAAAATIVDLQA